LIADHHNDVNQGQNACPVSSGNKKGGGHTYNIVYYKGKYRIMDYGHLGRYFYESQCWNQHSTDNIWNDHMGIHWEVNTGRANTYAKNYGDTKSCPTSGWNWRTVYKDVCQ